MAEGLLNILRTTMIVFGVAVGLYAIWSVTDAVMSALARRRVSKYLLDVQRLKHSGQANVTELRGWKASR